MTLDELEKKYVTEKRATDFIRWYEKYLPEKCEKFLEIGVRFGASAKMFKEWYGDVEMHLLDPFTLDNMTEEEAHSLGFITYKGSQNDLNLLGRILHKFDVISEDGSHHSDDQITTFKELFVNNLKNGGLYCLEDLHCCKQDYWWCTTKTFQDTFLGCMMRVRNGGDWTSQFFTEVENKYFKFIINKIEFHDNGDTSIAFIWRK